MKTQVKSIKSVGVPIALALSPSSKEAPSKITFKLEGSTVVQEYNHAVAQEKAWDKVKEETKPLLQVEALAELYAYNTANSETPVKTVCLVDDTGSQCNVTIKDTYGKTNLDPDTVIDGLVNLGYMDANKFVFEKVAVSFDTGVFYNANGSLNKEFYMEMLEACESIASSHGLPSPFSSKKVVSVKPGFAEKRWKDFTKDQQLKVSALFPAQVSITPIAPEK